MAQKSPNLVTKSLCWQHCFNPYSFHLYQPVAFLNSCSLKWLFNNPEASHICSEGRINRVSFLFYMSTQFCSFLNRVLLASGFDLSLFFVRFICNYPDWLWFMIRPLLWTLAVIIELAQIKRRCTHIQLPLASIGNKQTSTMCFKSHTHHCFGLSLNRAVFPTHFHVCVTCCYICWTSSLCMQVFSYFAGQDGQQPTVFLRMNKVC